MRLWHQRLIHYLPNKQLLGQHRECCALRGNGWGKKHSVVDYVFKHPYSWLFYYHYLVMCEMRDRGYSYDISWAIENYRGTRIKFIDPSDPCVLEDFTWNSADKFKWYWQSPQESIRACDSEMIYPEHDDAYLIECLDNLSKKNAELTNGMSISKMKMQIAIETGL